MTEIAGKNIERRVFKTKIVEKNPKVKATSEPSGKMALAIFLGAIFVPAIIFGLGVYMENQKNFQMTSYTITPEELAEIKSEYNLVGTTTVISVPNYEDVAASVFERDGRYEIAIVKYGDSYWIPDIDYRLSLQTADGSIIQMDRSFLRSVRLSLRGQSDNLPIKQNIERWSVEFT
ncbi:MAG: hypothetical protein V1732_03005 [Patescibacteria group bacterium]